MEVKTEVPLPSLKELVKDNIVRFSHYRAENFYYDIIFHTEEGDYHDTESLSSPIRHYNIYQFPVDVDDIGNATLLAEDKALTYMRWIRKSIDNHTLIKL